ncbi:MAG: sulfite exporter TauE/SafE family protein [Butyrivibrio sp.]|nr:sulfite exporter TauE/SafE family protein [Acetatifactor muris]MCM1559029.1 sulfite exporter TauE/SafE family protein [Butyrivibrio sp.]
MKELLFYIVILLANIIQGITGFAGTILAMPFSIMLVGYDTAKPVLNVLGLLSGIYVFLGNFRAVDRKELKKIVLVMTPGILAGMGIRLLLSGREAALYKALGVFVLLCALQGFYQKIAAERKQASAPGCAQKPGQEEGQAAAGPEPGRKGLREALNYALLGAAGIVHGIFVSGGPLLISYLAGRIDDKTRFRATISTVWILLNSIILAGDIRAGLWTGSNLKTLGIALPFFLGGMFTGGKLYRVMSRKVFLILTYILLFISGVSLLVK